MEISFVVSLEQIRYMISALRRIERELEDNRDIEARITIEIELTEKQK